MITTWVVRQFKNEFNPTHWHEGHISGAGFLKVPKNLGEFSQSKPSNTYQGGNLNLVHGQRAFLSKSTYHIFPKIVDLYFFPNYLMHHVYPFKNSDEERRVYNMYTKEQISRELTNLKASLLCEEKINLNLKLL